MRSAMTTSISRDELLEMLHGESPVSLVEALGPAYYADAHLPGAINIPLDQVDRLAPRLLPDPTVEVVVYSSATCDNAGIVARRLSDLGYERVRVYPGGKEDWVEHGLPVERPA
jgi:rhodanese-related sulfurtransferase